MIAYKNSKPLTIVQWDGSNEVKDLIESYKGPTMRNFSEGYLIVNNKNHRSNDVLRLGEYIILSAFPILYHILTQEEVDKYIEKMEIECIGSSQI